MVMRRLQGFRLTLCSDQHEASLRVVKVVLQKGLAQSSRWRCKVTVPPDS